MTVSRMTSAGGVPNTSPERSAPPAVEPPAADRPSPVKWLGWLGALGAATLGMVLVRGHLDKVHVTLVYLLLVLGASAGGGRALGLTVAAVSFLLFNFLFLPPYYTLVIQNPLDWLVLVAFFVTSVVAAELLYRARSTAETATARALEVDRLATLGAETLGAPGAGEALRSAAEVVRTALDADVCDVYVRDTHTASDARRAGDTRETPASADARTRLVRAAHEPRADVPSGQPGDAAAGLVEWVAESGRSAVELEDGTVRLAPATARPASLEPSGGPWRVVEAAGHQAAALQYAIRPPPPRARALSRVQWWGGDGGGDPQPDVRAVLLPLVVRDQTVGVLRVASADGVRLSPEQARLLVALAYYTALGVERVRLVESAERAEAERRLEALRSALLTAVSHDLLTPLTTIKGIAHEVAHGAPPARAEIIEAEADQLGALVRDLLDLSRIQAGAVRPDVAVNTADELIGAALQRASGALRGREVHVAVPDDDLLAGRFDFSQTLRVLVNLLENGAKYAPHDTPIDIEARRDGDRLTIGVLDRGPGIPPTETERIFEPFYRPPNTPPDVRGTGLGLSIARGLVEAQAGRLRYAPRPGGGAAFTLELPAAGEPELEAPVLEPELEPPSDRASSAA